jgi:tetratricopeptide (TPR) repeat protein
LLAAGGLQLRLAIQDQLIFGNNLDYLETSQIRNAVILTSSARQKHVFEADLDAALPLFQRALWVNPLYVPAWLGLAEIYNDLGKKSEASTVLAYADQLTEGIKRWRWDKAMTAYQLNNKEMLPGELRFIVGEIAGKTRHDALEMGFSLWEEPEELLRNVGAENVFHLHNHAVRKKLPQKALFFWHEIEREQLLWKEKDVFAMLDMLLATDNTFEAAAIWRKYFNSDSILYNGDFTKPFLNRAFGWRIGKDKDFVQRLEHSETGNRMMFRFKGWDNLNFYHFNQIVPVTGGKVYELSAEIASKKLTTDQRPFLEVYGYRCQLLYANSEMVLPDQEMVPIAFRFGVPEECNAIVVGLRRKESRQIDSKLSGQLWLGNLAVTDTGKVFSIFNTPLQ